MRGCPRGAYDERAMLGWLEDARAFGGDVPDNGLKLGRLFLEYMRGRLLFCTEDRRFRVLGPGHVWDVDTEKHDRTWRLLARFVAACEEHVARELGADPDEGERAALWFKALKSCSTSAGMQLALRSAAAECSVPLHMFDRDPDCLGTPDGVWALSGRAWIDLVTNCEVDPDSLLVSKSLAESPYCEHTLDWDPDPRWAEFVLEVMGGDEERASYLKRALGYSCFGGNAEECMFVAYGPTTRNGKSTLLNSVAHALGDYAQSLSPQLVLESRSDEDWTAPNPVLARTVGVRLVVLGETRDERQVLSSSKVKAYTGQDPVTTRALYREPFEFVPQFTMWMHCNHLPEADDPGLFGSRRIRVVPFERHFEASEQDLGLKRRFGSERGAKTILAWLSEGYCEYRWRGLDEPPSVREATRAYMEESDALGSFLAQRCVIREGERHPAPKLYREFKRWFLAQGGSETPPSARAFGKELRLRGFEKRPSNGVEYFCGVTLAEAGGR